MDGEPADTGTREPVERPGLPLRPRSPARVAATIGALWGLVGYSILWEGLPIEVSREFVASVAGTIALLPSRVVIWAILSAEDLAGRTFDLSRSYSWIAPVAAAVGAVIAIAILGALRVLRTRSAPGRQPL